MSRNSLAAIAATVVVVIVVALGFYVLGGPGTQRLVQSDLRIVRSLADLARQINFKWNNSGKVLPRTLDNVTDSAKQNPITHELFLYHPKSNSEYELCATFATDNRNAQMQNTNNQWAHPKGPYCFELDASQPVPPAPYLY